MRSDKESQKIAIAAHQNIKEKEFWLKKLDGELVKSCFPYDYKRKKEMSEHNFKTRDFALTGELFSQLRYISGGSDHALHMIFTAAIVLLLGKYTYNQRKDILVGVPIYKQMEDKEFINTVVVLRNRFNTSFTFKELLLQVKQKIVEALENQNYPIEMLVEQLKPGLAVSIPGDDFPLFDVAVLCDGIHHKKYLEHLNINMTFSFSPPAECIEGMLTYNASRYKETTGRRIITQLTNLMKTILTNVDTPLMGIDFFTEEEKHQLLVDFNRVNINREPSELSPDKTIHRLFREMAAKSPGDTALLFEGDCLTYGELDKKSNQLAHLIRKKGIGPDHIVGIMLDYCLEMIIGVLAVLKSGAAYLPITPETPPSRIRSMLRDSNCSLLLTREKSIKDLSYIALQDFEAIGIVPYLSLPRPQVEELDALQVPDRSSIDYEKYRPYIGQAMVKNSITIHMSRGCVFNCAYCFKIWPKKYIIRSAENIFNEIRLYHDMGIRRFAFVDDLPNINMKVSSKVFRLIIQNGLKVHLHFPNGIRGDILTKEYIDLMVEAGTITMDLALETTSPRLQKLIRKNLNLKRLADNIQYITEKHPHVILELQIIHGIPSETEEEARQSLEFIKNIKWVHFPYIHILNIYPRSDMAEIAVKHGISGEAIRRSADLAYHELPETLPFPGSFTRKYQSEFLNEYFLSKERLLSVLPYQMKVLTEDELVQKYNSYLPAEISTFSQLLEYAGISRDQLDGEFLPEGYGVVPGLNEKLAAHFGPLRNPTGQKALRVLLLDLSQYFTHDTKIMYDVVEPPLGLMYVLTHLNRTFGSKINVKIAKSRIDFDSHERLKALLLDLKPDVIGIRTLNFYKDFFHKTISLIRQWGVNVPIIAGGPYATSNYPTMLNDKNIDLAVVGEGEIIFAEVIAKILQNNGKLPGKETLKGIPGLAFVEEDHPLRKRHNREVLLLDKIMDTLSQESGQNPEHINRTADLAYIIYTSGSTGAPKGVMIQHRNLVNQIMALRNEFDLDASLHYLLLASFTFDVSIMHIFLPLTTGAKLFLITDETRKESAKLWQFIFENKITVLNIVPTFMSALLESIEKKKISFKYLFVGGDVFPAKLYNGLQETFNFEQVINIYGPTETTINALLYRLPENLSREIIPIGRPLMSYSVYIVDSDLNPVPVEVSGELCISGRGVARGYLNHPELTAEKFRSAVTGSSKSSPNDQCPMTNDRFYRTGDLARWLPDGNVEFIGRIDRQVKVRGFRIELGEIEKHLSRIDNVKEVLVITNQSTEGDKYISAYIVSEKPFKPSHLRDYLKNRLPGYMIPSYFIPIKRIPVTPGGKVDKKQLPDPQITGDYVAPRDNIDAKLVALWAAVLAKDANRIGIDTNFFELGGHSLKATILISRIHKEFNTRIPMVEFFSTPTIRGLSRYIKDTEDERFVVIAKAEKKDYYVLSSSQKRLFVLQRLEPENTVYNMPVLLEMEGKIDKERLENCFKKLIGRHDNLKTSFEMIKSGLVQRIRDQVEFSIEYFDLSATGDTAKMRHQHSSRIIHDFVRPFELSHPPLLRVGLVKLGEKKQIYMMDMHHIITDGVSMNIFTKEIMALYQRMELPGINIQYRDYSEWQHSEKVREVIKKQEAYWMKQFQVPPPALNLPFDYPRPAVQSFEGSSVGFGIGIEKTGKLKELALKEDVTLFVLLLTVSTLFLSKISGQEDITVGTPIAGRQHADLEYILGVFINMLALRNYPKGEKNFKEFLAEVKKTTLDALENQGYPFEDLVEKTPVERDVGRNPLFDVFFSLDNHQLTHGEIDNIEIPELNSKQYGYENPISKFDLSFYAADLGQNLHFTLEYCNKLFKRETIEAFSLYFKKIVSSILEDPCKKLAQIEIIPGEEKHRVLYDFNNTGAEFSRDKTIHRLFEEQVVKTPGRIAIVGTVPGAGHGAQGMDKHCVLTYSELNRKSNQLAHQLRKKEVKPGTIVGIMVERSIEMILGIIAILKAGGAYLPIDLAYPGQRVNIMLKDAGVELLLSHDGFDVKIGGAFEIIDLKDLNLYKEEGENLKKENASTDLAYVIYTSGSTGRPKGVMVEHTSVINTLTALQNRYPFMESDVYLLKTSYIFDVSVTELFGWFMEGGRLAILEKGGEKNPVQIFNAIENRLVTHINFVPSMFTVFLQSLDPRKLAQLSTVKYIFLAGEAIIPEQMEKIKRLETDTGIRLENIYGPTEATVYASWYSLSQWDGAFRIPIGKPLNNVRLYVLDKDGGPLPVGIPGELYISGAGLARGYLNRPELTAEKFIELEVKVKADVEEKGAPFGQSINALGETNKNKKGPGKNYPSPITRHSSLIYKTGDLVRWLPEGNIEFIGRIDNQVKIRGFRIELGEIENKLQKYEKIKEAVVLAIENEDRDRDLYAYVVSGDNLDASELKEYLLRELPGYMVPAYFVQIDSIPLTSSGKVDRKTLQSNREKLTTGVEFTPPQKELEIAIAGAWRKILKIENQSLSINDNFFDVGGNSVNILKLAMELETLLAADIHVAKLFQYPTVASYAKYLENRENIEDILKKEKQLEQEFASAKNRLRQKRKRDK